MIPAFRRDAHRFDIELNRNLIRGNQSAVIRQLAVVNPPIFSVDSHVTFKTDPVQDPKDAQETLIAPITLPPKFELGASFPTQDLHLSREFKLHDRWRMNLIGEVFNLFNIPNLSGRSSSSGQPGQKRTQTAPSVDNRGISETPLLFEEGQKRLQVTVARQPLAFDTC
jgi:hypothetical protein